MKSIALLGLLLVETLGGQQNQRNSGVNAQASSELEAVLTQMDQASATFKTAQADCEWDSYEKVVDETEKQKGQVYFRRDGSDVEALFDINSPRAKQILFKSGRVSLYVPKIDQITEYAPAPKANVESFLSLGFGARGHDLLKSYQVTMVGWETVDTVRTAKLLLTALSPRVRSRFSEFVIWTDPQRDIPLKQQINESSGDYWVQHCTGFILNGRISEDVFRLKTTPRTKVVKPE